MTEYVRRWPLLARRLARVSVVALAAAFLLAWIRLEVLLREAERVCRNPAIVAHQTSPDGAWDAVVDEAVCTHHGLVSLTTRTFTTVRLVSTRDPSFAGQILYTDSPGRRDYARPLLAWTAPGVLRITFGKSPHVRTLRFAGVTVDLRVDPDDPAIRAAMAELEGGHDAPPGEAARASKGH